MRRTRSPPHTVMTFASSKPTAAYIGASWAAMLTGSIAFMVGLVNAKMFLNEKGYYLTLLLFGLFAVISLQKSVRDRLEGVHVTSLYYSLCVGAVAAPLTLLVVGLWNADLALSEKGFYGMAFVLALFGAISVQKNVRDLASLDGAAEARVIGGGEDERQAFAGGL